MGNLIKLLKLKRPVYPGAAAGLRGMNLKTLLPFLLAAAVGLAAALAAGRFHVQYVNTHREMVQVIVPARDIPPYTVITEADLTTTPVPVGGEDPGAVRDASEIVGRLALHPLYKGEQVRRERLVDPSVVKDRQVVSLSIDVARCVGGALQPGSLVDVWWVSDPAVPGTWQLAAADAVVLDLKDSSGKSVIQQQASLVQQALTGGGGSAGPSSPPAVAVLAVKSADVPRVVGGASMKSQSVVLAKKYTEGGVQQGVAVQIAPQQQPGVAPGAAAAAAGAAAAGGGAGSAGAAAQPAAPAAAR